MTDLIDEATQELRMLRDMNEDLRHQIRAIWKLAPYLAFGLFLAGVLAGVLL